jgi:Ca2+-transporting ATPase
MITGDHPSTALAIARAAGIEVSAGVLTGAEVAALSPSELGERLRDVRVFARIAPEQKLAIVEALKANGEVVAMTGDGVNDAPALEAAHIGVAMGEKGSDVAREAADLVLLDDNFASIVGGVRLGRRIFANLRRALVYVTAIHVPIAGLALAPVLLGWPPLLLPMHVVLMELAIDPICALAFEGEPSHRDAMRRPPRPPGEPLFGPVQLGLALLQGLVVLIAVLGVYAWALAGHGEDQARGAAFLALVLGNLILALGAALSGAGRLFARHRLTYWAIAASVSATLAVIMAWPPLASVFKVAAPDPALLALSLAAALLSGGWLGLSQRLAAALEARSRPQAADRPDRVMSV